MCVTSSIHSRWAEAVGRAFLSRADQLPIEENFPAMDFRRSESTEEDLRRCMVVLIPRLRRMDIDAAEEATQLLFKLIEASRNDIRFMDAWNCIFEACGLEFWLKYHPPFVALYRHLLLDWAGRLKI